MEWHDEYSHLWCILLCHPFSFNWMYCRFEYSLCNVDHIQLQMYIYCIHTAHTVTVVYLTINCLFSFEMVKWNIRTITNAKCIYLLKQFLEKSARDVHSLLHVSYDFLFIFSSRLISHFTLQFVCTKYTSVCMCTIQFTVTLWVCVCVYYTHCVRWHYSPTYKDVTRCMNNTWSKWFAINRFKCLGKWCTQMCAFLLFQRMCLYIYIMWQSGSGTVAHYTLCTG